MKMQFHAGIMPGTERDESVSEPWVSPRGTTVLFLSTQLVERETCNRKTKGSSL